MSAVPCVAVSLCRMWSYAMRVWVSVCDFASAYGDGGCEGACEIALLRVSLVLIMSHVG